MKFKKLLQYFRNISKVDIVKVFSLNAFSTFIHMCTGLISTKIVATIVGPTGIALLGQLSNLNSMLQGLAAGGIRSGVTKYISEYKNDKKRINAYISNALYISIFCSTIISIVCIGGNQFLSEKILMSAEYGYVFIILGITIYLYTFNSIFISILNGFKEFRKYVIVNISSSFFSLIFTVILCLIWELKGAMISAVTFQSVVFFVTLYLCKKCEWFKRSNFISPIDKKILYQYVQYSLMTLTTLSITPVVQMYLRSYVMTEISEFDAGLWEGCNRISSIYLNIITTSLSVYILPRLSEISDKLTLKKEIYKSYKLIVPFLLFCSVIIYLARHQIIRILFTPEFDAMESLIIWQLFADFFKVCSWLISFLMLAKAKTLYYIITEVFFGGMSLGIRYMLVCKIGVMGLNIGAMINSFLYFIVMIILFRDILFFKDK